jgi:hypothetical protein
MALVALLLGSCTLIRPSAAQAPSYTYFPSADVRDGRMLTQGGAPLETLAGQPVFVRIRVPAGATQFELGIFDGDTGKDNSGAINPDAGDWDFGTSSMQYRLFVDANVDGTPDGAAVATFDGNGANASTAVATIPVSGMPNNDWWTAFISTAGTPQATGGGFAYLLQAQITEPAKAVASNFKLRSTGRLSIPANAVFGVEGALRVDADIVSLYPAFTFPLPSPDFLLTTPTRYDGTWSFFFDLPGGTNTLEVWDGGLDYGSQELTGIPSGVAVADRKDTDDPDTTGVPGFAAGSTAQPEGAKGPGQPRDDSALDLFRRLPANGVAVQYRLIDPTGGNFLNDNPSGNQEWERFVVSGNGSALSSGRWSLRVEGLDLSNAAYFRVPFEVLGVTESGTPPAGGLNATVRGNAVIGLGGNNKGRNRAIANVNVTAVNGVLTGFANYNNKRTKKNFKSTQITGLTVNGSVATITGVGKFKKKGPTVGFTLEITDGEGVAPDQVRFFTDGETPPAAPLPIKTGDLDVTSTP